MDRLSQTGGSFGSAPARRPGRRGVGGRKPPPVSKCSSTPDQRVGGSFTLRACPPTRLHAPNVYAPSYTRSVLCKRLVSVPPWVGPHPQRTPPPGTPPHPPTPTPTPPGTPPRDPTPTTCQSEWKAIPSGWQFQVDGFSKCMAVPRGPTSTQHKDRLQSMQKALTASVGSLYLLSSHNAAPFVMISPRSTPRAPQELPGAHQEHPVAPRSTREHPGALEPV